VWVPPFALRIPSRDEIRTALADALRDKVIGPDADAKFAIINETEGPHWFADDRPIRRVHGDASMFIGGMRALLLQSLHPLAMAGVAQHSDYRHDPWGRLQRTAEFLAVTTFAPSEVAEQAVARVRAVHERVRGTTRDGIEYSASDPHLLRWVHLAEVDSFLATHQLFGERPLSADERDAYVEDAAVVARKLGVPAPPTTEHALRDQLLMYRSELHNTPECRDAMKYLLLQPPLAVPARVPYSLIAIAAIATLPVWARAKLRLPWLPLTERFAVLPMGGTVTRTIRWAIASEATGAAVG
jgi:uncharacterized protein (DUF2236 family)